MKKKWRALSLQKMFIVYVVIAILFLAVAIGITFALFLEWLESVQVAGNTFAEVDGLIIQTPSRTTEESAYARFVNKFVSAGSVVLPMIYSSIALYLVSKAYYSRIIQKPIAVLSESAQRIIQNDLDFEVTTERGDELSQLCISFETMRKSLYENNQKMWKMMEERKRVNAAFAHDLRTPLTVLRGYQDFLLTYVPAGKVSEEKMLATLSTMSKHVARLEEYVNTMNQLEGLEQIRVVRVDHSVLDFVQMVRDTVDVLQAQTGRFFTVLNEITLERFHIDPALVMQVTENLISNAVRYAKSSVFVTLSVQGEHLCITVEDDGAGFESEAAMQKAIQPYEKDESGHGHMGMGLHIAKTLCEQHGGSLELSNQEEGGANISALFSCYR